MNKNKERDSLTARILDLTLEIIFMLTGDDHTMVKIREMVNNNIPRHISERSCRSQSFNTELPPQSGIHEQNHEKILELSNQIIHLLTGEVPIRCEDVTVHLSMEEWEYLEGHRDHYKDTMMNHQPINSLVDKPARRELHTPVSYSDFGTDNIPNNGQQYLNKELKGLVELAPPTQESLASKERHVPEKNLYPSTQCTEFSPSNIKEKSASCGEESLTDGVIYQCAEYTQTKYTSCLGTVSDLNGDFTDPVIYPPTECRDTEYPNTDIKNESPPWEEGNVIDTDMHKPPDPAQTEWSPDNMGENIKSNPNPLEINNSESLIQSRKPDESLYYTDNIVTSNSDYDGNSVVSSTFCGENSTPASAHKHQHIHTKEQPFSGPEYQKLFKCRIVLKKHQGIYTEKKQFKCTECEKCFNQASHLVEHKKIHIGVKTFKCTECEKCFNRASHLMEHRKMHMEEETYKCTECGKCFNWASHLERHKIIHKGEKTFDCSECGKSFATSSSLARHEKFHTEQKTFNCSDCETSFTEASSLAKHKLTHTGEKTFYCPECGKCFNRASHLARHKMTHKGEKPFKCPECRKCFTTAIHLARHKNIHMAEKPFKCLECGKCFTEASSVVRHKKSHTGAKTFSCPDCEKCFTEASSLAKHKMIHTGKKTFKCTECGKCLKWASDLARHKMTHTGEKPFKCPECGKCFTRASTLSTHRISHTE